MSGPGPFRLTAGLGAALPGTAAAFEVPQSFSDVGPGFWAIIAVVCVGLLAFLFWALYGRHGDPEQRASTGKYHAAGALVIVLMVFTLVLYIAVATRVQGLDPTDRAWDWKPGETLTDPGGSGLEGEPYRGYQIYLAEGCVYCHTQYIRKEDIPTGWAVGATQEDISQTGDFVGYPFTLLGTQRNGPDLTIIGRQIPNMRYHIDHLERPREFKPESIMPSYAHLSDRNLRDLAAYLVTLGHSKEALKAGEAGTPSEAEGAASAEEDPQVAKGREVFNAQGCNACHTTDGSASTGPTLKGLWGSQVTLKSGESATADADFIRESVVEPNATVVEGFPPVMPNRYGDLPEEDLEALIAFIRSLGDSEGGS